MSVLTAIERIQKLREEYEAVKDQMIAEPKKDEGKKTDTKTA